jgi:hypothetical protein
MDCFCETCSLKLHELIKLHATNQSKALLIPALEVFVASSTSNMSRGLL